MKRLFKVFLAVLTLTVFQFQAVEAQLNWTQEVVDVFAVPTVVAGNINGNQQSITYQFGDNEVKSVISQEPVSYDEVNNRVTILHLMSDGETSAEVETQNGNFHIDVTNQLLTFDGFTPVNETGFYANDGSITISPRSGTQPYTFLWNDGNVNQNRTGLSKGAYQVTMTDADGHQAKLSINVGRDSDRRGRGRGRKSGSIGNIGNYLSYTWLDALGNYNALDGYAIVIHDTSGKELGVFQSVDSRELTNIFIAQVVHLESQNVMAKLPLMIE